MIRRPPRSTLFPLHDALPISGAFMQDIEKSRELARTMVDLGTDAGVTTTALLTNMNVPLGLAIGNANEVRESVEVLAGGGPADVVWHTLALGGEMVDRKSVVSGKSVDAGGCATIKKK